MKENFPFHYEVRCNFLAFTEKNNVRKERFTRTFEKSDPLKNRKDAFEAFEDYLNLLEQHNRIEINKQGNPEIIRPSFIPDFFPEFKMEGNQEEVTFEEYAEALEQHMNVVDELKQFREEIEVVLVIRNREIRENVDPFFEPEYDSPDYVIHRVTSYDHDQQTIIDNLESVELSLFDYFKIDYGDLKQTVYHYGVDYSESGEDEEEGAKRTILSTPHQWASLEYYKEIMDEDEEEDSDKIGLDLSSIIAQGESKQVEFKPTLLYNFSTQKAGFSIKKIIAKTICAFLNSDGGFLFIGVTDTGNIQGLDHDYSLFPEENGKDKLRLEFDSLLFNFFGISITPLITFNILKVEEKDIIFIEVSKSQRPIFMKYQFSNNIYKEFYIRMSASSHQITDMEELANYVLNNNWEKK